MKVVRFKPIQLLLRRSSKRQRIQQAGFTQGVSPSNSVLSSSIRDSRLMPRKPTISIRSRTSAASRARRRLFNGVTFTEHGQKPLAGQAANVKSAALLRLGLLVSVCSSPPFGASKLKDTSCTMYSGLLIILLPLIVGYLIPTPSPAAGADQPAAELDGVRDPVFHGYQRRSWKISAATWC